MGIGGGSMGYNAVPTLRAAKGLARRAPGGHLGLPTGPRMPSLRSMGGKALTDRRSSTAVEALARWLAEEG
jgi:hypothetical protein